MPKFAGDHSDAEPREARTVTGSPVLYAVLQAQAAARESDFQHSAEAMDRRYRSELLRRLERFTGKPDAEYRAIYRQRFNEFLRSGEHNGFLTPTPMPLSAYELRDLGEGVNAAGGYLVPQEMNDQLTISIASWSHIYANCRRINTAEGAALAVPVAATDTATSGVIQAENTAFTEADPTLTTTTFHSFAIVTAIKYSWQLAHDVAPSLITGDFAPLNPENNRSRGGFSLTDQLMTIVGERIGRKIGSLLAAGTGTGQPTGLGVGTTVGFTASTGHTTTVGLADLVALENSVDVAYRDDAVFVMHPNSWQSIVASLSTSTGVVYNPFSAEQPPTLLGYRVLLDPNFQVMAASQKSIFFGSLRRAYAVRTVGDPAVIVLKERFAEQLQSALICWIRIDGNVLDPNAGRLLANSAT